MPISEAILPDLTIALDVVGGVRHREVVRVALDHPVDQVDLLDHGPRGVLVLARDVDRPELGLDPPSRSRGMSVSPLGSRLVRSFDSRPRSLATTGAARGGRCARRRACPEAWTLRARSETGNGSSATAIGPANRAIREQANSGGASDESCGRASMLGASFDPSEGEGPILDRRCPRGNRRPRRRQPIDPPAPSRTSGIQRRMEPPRRQARKERGRGNVLIREFFPFLSLPTWRPWRPGGSIPRGNRRHQRGDSRALHRRPRSLPVIRSTTRIAERTDGHRPLAGEDTVSPTIQRPGPRTSASTARNVLFRCETGGTAYRAERSRRV